MYLKRDNTKKFWPVPRKGTKYLAVASHNKGESVPLLVMMRDSLGIVKNKKELKNLLNEGQILINHKQIRETNYPVCLFDVITFKNAKKNYRAVLSKNNKLVLDEITEKEAETKIYKVIKRKKLGEDKIQLNLNQGKNIPSNEKIKTGDSVILNIKNNKIVKIIPIEKGRKAFSLKGKHAGISGKIIEIMERGDKKIVKIEFGHERINVWTKNIMVIE